MPNGNRPTGVLLGIVPKLSWRGKNKKERETPTGYPEKAFCFTCQ